MVLSDLIAEANKLKEMYGDMELLISNSDKVHGSTESLASDGSRAVLTIGKRVNYVEFPDSCAPKGG